MKFTCKNCQSIIILNAFTKTKCEICDNEIYSPHIPGYVICEDCLNDMADNGTIICRQCGNVISENSNIKNKNRAIRRKASIYAKIRKNKLQNNIKDSKQNKSNLEKVKLSKKDSVAIDKYNFEMNEKE